MGQSALFVEPEAVLHPSAGARAIESESFPFEAISDVAERESWRKEINRPIYHVHKWWAQRLGSVFRAIIIGALAPDGADVLGQFYSRTRFPKAVVFDPFMGSGTTLGEALKLGCRAIGRDINPVAYFLVRNALETHSRAAIEAAFAELTRSVEPQISRFYECRLPDGSAGTVLYFFWTKTLPCPSCSAPVDLMGSRIFAQHAYPKRYPESRALCPVCGEINTVRYDADDANCCGCGSHFNPRSGPARGTKAKCPCCATEFPIAATARARGCPPEHRLYAKLVLTKDGRKVYAKADDFDLKLYAEAERELSESTDLFPVVPIEPGYNTNQVLNYGYTHWHEMFNSRQLLCLGTLARAIQQIREPEVRDALTCLFSGALEFNNMFASYKGEGTGAVRHMFYHHILKPERTPLEANVWGTAKSSGSFSGMLRSRLMRALDYASDPFEIKPDGQKVLGLSEPIGVSRAETAEQFLEGRRLYVSCGDSSATDLPTGSVDVVVTDPPFFDNVNYSQLADFFHVWQQHILSDEKNIASTRSPNEVQHQDADVFGARLAAVLAECWRVLKDDGLLVFSYHHSRAEGWTSVLEALQDAGFVVTASVPVKAEMAGAAPKNQAKEPIDLDIILVCRKAAGAAAECSISEAHQMAEKQVRRLTMAGRKLSRNDVRVILMGQLLRSASQGADASQAFDAAAVEAAIESMRPSAPNS